MLPEHKRTRAPQRKAETIAYTGVPYLDRIPVDVLRPILEHLDHVDIYHLCLVNHALCVRAEPSLYRVIKLSVGGAEGKPRLQFLLWTLLRRRPLASQIQIVEFESPLGSGTGSLASLELHDDLTRYRKSSEHRELIELSQKYLKYELNIEYPQFWLRKLQRQDATALIAFFLTLTSNLRVFRIPYILDRDMVADIIKDDIYQRNSKRRFASLRRVEFVHHNNDDNIHLFQRLKRASQAVPLLGISSLQELIGGLTHGGFYPPPNFQSASNLRVLDLKHSQDYDKDLSCLLQHTPALEELSLRIAPAIANAMVFGEVSFESEHLLAALRHVSPTLQILRLSVFQLAAIWEEVQRRRAANYETRAAPDFRPEPDKGIKYTLHGFRKLRTLEIPFLAMFGRILLAPVTLSQMLPPNLSSFSLNDDCIIETPPTASVFASLVSLFEDMHLVGPKLKTYTLSLKKVNVDWNAASHHAVIKSCKAAGVDYKLRWV